MYIKAYIQSIFFTKIFQKFYQFLIFLIFIVLGEIKPKEIKKNVRELFIEITIKGLHIHYINELDNTVNSYISEVTLTTQIPYTVHNIYRETLPHVICSIWDSFYYKCRNLTSFKPLLISKIKQNFNSYSSIITIFLPEFKNLPNRSIVE